MKNTAKAKQAAMLAHQHEMLRKRAETAQQQRKNAAAAKKDARERETAAKARKNSCVDTVCTALCSFETHPIFRCLWNERISRRVALSCRIGVGPMSQRQRGSLGLGETAKLGPRSNDQFLRHSSTYSMIKY